MRHQVFVLTSLLLPSLAVAQSLDITGDAPPLLETDDEGLPSPPTLEDLEDQVNSKGPVLVEPKFDLTPEEPDDLNLNQTDPEPAPGLIIKIPTGQD